MNASACPLPIVCRVWKSSIGRKFIVALTGLVLVLFLAGHLAGNLLVFAGREAFNDYAGHLSSVDRGQAKALLTNQRSVIQQRLSACLRVAYGIDTEPKDAVQAALEGSSHFQSLDKTFRPRPPVGGSRLPRRAARGRRSRSSRLDGHGP